MTNDLILLGMMQGAVEGTPGEPCDGCDPYGPVTPGSPVYGNCRFCGGDLLPCYDQLYHDGCCGTIWVTFMGACP